MKLISLLEDGPKVKKLIIDKKGMLRTKDEDAPEEQDNKVVNRLERDIKISRDVVHDVLSYRGEMVHDTKLPNVRGR